MKSIKKDQLFSNFRISKNWNVFKRIWDLNLVSCIVKCEELCGREKNQIKKSKKIILFKYSFIKTFVFRDSCLVSCTPFSLRSSYLLTWVFHQAFDIADPSSM